jgi:hypothetical protein
MPFPTLQCEATSVGAPSGAGCAKTDARSSAVNSRSACESHDGRTRRYASSNAALAAQARLSVSRSSAKIRTRHSAVAWIVESEFGVRDQAFESARAPNRTHDRVRRARRVLVAPYVEPPSMM